MYGTVFPDKSEEGYSHLRIWESCGFIVSFALCNSICTDIKIYLLMAVLVIGMIMYYVAEWQLRNQHKEVDNINIETSQKKSITDVNMKNHFEDNENPVESIIYSDINEETSFIDNKQKENATNENEEISEIKGNISNDDKSD